MILKNLRLCMDMFSVNEYSDGIKTKGCQRIWDFKIDIMEYKTND